MTLSVILCGPGLFIQSICLFVGCVANRPGLCVQSVSTFIGCIPGRAGLLVEPCRIDVGLAFGEIGRASVRGRACQTVWLSVVAGSLKKNKHKETNNGERIP